MQQPLAIQYDLVCAVADMVSAHGTHDFSCGDDGAQTQAAFYGLNVYFVGQLPVRLTAHDLELIITAKVPAQNLDEWLGGENHRLVHALGNAEYTLTFRNGDISTLQNWRDKLDGFVASTTRKVA